MSNPGAALLCPSCGESGDLRVVESRAVPSTNTIRRRRQCACGARFTTHERIGGGVDADRLLPMLDAMKRSLDELRRRIAS